MKMECFYNPILSRIFRTLVFKEYESYPKVNLVSSLCGKHKSTLIVEYSFCELNLSCSSLGIISVCVISFANF